MGKKRGERLPSLTRNRLIAAVEELSRSNEAITKSLEHAKPTAQLVLKNRLARIEDLLSVFQAILEAKGEV